MSRWMHPPWRERSLAAKRFDPIAEGERRGLPRDIALALWDHVCSTAMRGDAVPDFARLEQRFYELATRLARGFPLTPHPGRTTQVIRDIASRRAGQAATAACRPHTPGRETLVITETRRWEQLEGEPVHDEEATVAPHPASTPPYASEVAELQAQLSTPAEPTHGAGGALAMSDPAVALEALRAIRDRRGSRHVAELFRGFSPAAHGDVERALTQRSAGARLPEGVVARMEPHVGRDAAQAALVHTDEAADVIAAAHHAHAVTHGPRIFFSRGAYAPGTPHGDELLAHELTHVAQGQRGELTRAAAKGIESGETLDAVEAEAELRGKLAAVEIHAPAAAPPPLAAPSGQPASEGDREAQLAAQQQRMSLAGQTAPPLAPSQAPAALNPQAPAAHPGPAFHKPPAAASNGNSYVETFEAPPSKQAVELWAHAGTKATTQTTADQAKFDGGLQPIPVVLDGSSAKDKSGAGAAKRAPAQPPSSGAVPPAAKPTSTPPPPSVTAGATAAQAIRPTDSAAQIKANGEQLINNLPTTSPDVKTDPGPAPVADLAGQADPVRTVGDHQHFATEGAKAFDDAKAKLLAGPGAAGVQPVKLDDKVPIPKPQASGPMPTLPTVDGMAKLKQWNLPDNALSAFDTVAKPKMEASLVQAKAKMTEADHKRDSDRDKAVTDAQAKVKQSHVDADKQQQDKVAQARTQIANHQSETLVKHEQELRKLDQQSGDRKQAALSKVNARVQADQSKVERDYQTAQKQAEDKKRQGEAEAARKKQEAQEKQKHHHWWDRAADDLCHDIQAVAHEIDSALEAIGKAIGDILDAVKNAACGLIDATRDFVCKALSEFGDWLKQAVDALIGSVFPELAAALDRMIDAAVNAAKAAVNAVANGLKKLVTALCDSLKAALDAVIAAYRAAVQAAAVFAQAAVTGNWKLVAKMVLEGILKLLGIDPAAFYALVGEAEDSIEKIIHKPGAFVGHLIDAVKLGFKQFGAHFLTHLKDGVVQWLFGTFAQAGITMPASFDVAGIFDLVCQVLGLTWPRLRPKVVKLVGEKNAERLDFVDRYVQGLMAGGFHGLWAQVQQDMSGLWDIVIGGVESWLMQQVVQQAILKIATMWNPAGAIIQLIETAWNVYQWVKENAQRIFGLVQAVVDSMANIVAGNIGGAANFIEASLAKLVPVAISLFADLLGLGGIADKIRGIIEKVQTKIDQAIDKLIARVMGMFKGKDGKDTGKGTDEEKSKREDQDKVPTALAESHKVRLTHLSDAIKAQAGKTPNKTILYQAPISDPKEATKALLANHPDAKFNKTSGMLSLPPVKVNATPNSLETLAAEVGQSTGVSRVTFVTTDKGWRLDGSINPDVSDLVSNEEEDPDCARARAKFELEPFTTQQLSQLLGIALRTAQKRTEAWCAAGSLFRMRTEQGYTFDASKVAVEPVGEGEHPSKYVDKKTWEVKSDYNIRDIFYKNYFRKDNLNTVLTREDSGQKNAAGDTLYRCLGGWGPNHVPLLTRSELQIEHKIDVTVHWNVGDKDSKPGRETTQGDRNEWYDSPAHLTVLCPSCNASKPSGRYERKVGIGFRGVQDP